LLGSVVLSGNGTVPVSAAAAAPGRRRLNSSRRHCCRTGAWSSSRPVPSGPVR